MIVIPPIPEWNMAGGKEDDVLEVRRQELQSFVDRVNLHPVLSFSNIWKLFISETNDKVRSNIRSGQFQGVKVSN